MHELFGVSLTTIAVAMVVLFVLTGAVVVSLALRYRIIFKLGVRNIPRHPTQTVLIVVGLMLSTIIITAAFGTGDTVVYTIRSMAAESLGNTDEVVTVPSRKADPDSGYFDYARFDEITSALSSSPVDGVLPVIYEDVPLFNPYQLLSAPSVRLFAPGPQYAGYTHLTTIDGRRVSLEDLGPSDVYIDQDTADELLAEAGAQLVLFVGSEPKYVRLAGVVEGASCGSLNYILLPLGRAQDFFGRTGQINGVYISNSGSALDGAGSSDEIARQLEPVLLDTDLEVNAVKKETLHDAEMSGAVLTGIFLLFGLFCVAAGILLVFLIFVMLAAARKSEMGMARAVGTTRSQLVQMFVFEGVVYDLLASLVGVGLGVGLTYAISGVMARVVRDYPIEISVHVEPRSLVVAFTLGMLVTFGTVTMASWRVSRLNIVRAIRDIPEPPTERAGRRSLELGLAVGAFGVGLSVVGVALGQVAPVYLGVALVIMGVALVARWRGFGERQVFTLAGMVLVGWSLVPIDVFESIFGGLDMGMEMFFFAGVTMVLGAVWVVSYNLDLILHLLVAVVGRFQNATPVLRSAMAYPMKNRLRTGLTMAMFALIIFTIVFMSVVIRADAAVLSDTRSVGGGYDVLANVNWNSPVAGGNIEEAMADKGFKSGDFVAVAGISSVPLEIRQSGATAEEWKQYLVHGVDGTFMETNGFGFSVMAQGYRTAREVWLALRDNPGLAVISADAVPSRSPMSISYGEGFKVEGIYQEDADMGPFEVQVRASYAGLGTIEKNLTVIGVLQSVSTTNVGIYTSQETVDEAAAPYLVVPVTTYLFKLAEGVDATTMANTLEAAFRENGMQADSIDDQLREAARVNYTVNSLLTGFMGLGVVIGIAGLGVISTRAVVERRHQIGILRAIGFKRSSVQASFLLESSIVASLGVLIGTLLALALSYQVLDDLKDTIENVKFQIPWVEMMIIAGVCWCASMLMTLIPAWQVSKIYPAEALRYE